MKTIFWFSLLSAESCTFMATFQRMKKVLLTGAAGFIGFHTAKRLLAHGYTVFGLDSIMAYYEVGLKLTRLKECGIDVLPIPDRQPLQSKKYPNYRFIKQNLDERDQIHDLFRQEQFDYVVHLAAQPGVRESITNPFSYIDSNINGFITILEGCRHFGVSHLIFASSSSVYGNAVKVPFSESDNVDHPVSLYAATKKSGELMAYTYSHLYNLPVTALRFFTVYGPYGRPDMAYFKFVKAVLEGKEIEVFNNGEQYRDFTYIDDVVDGLQKILPLLPACNPPFEIYNIGNSSPVHLMDFIRIIEEETGVSSRKKMMPPQPGDVTQTFADIKLLENRIGFKPKIPVREGIRKFVAWYRSYYNTPLKPE
jgi:UDP-glucuronate 4-epimerase